MPPPNNKVTKPRVNNFKSSDRRLASGVRPEAYLLSEQQKAKESKINATLLAQQSQSRSSTPQPLNNPHKPSNKNNKSNVDHTLEEWDPKHFRLFVGNLGSDANDALLIKAFSAYPSVSKVKVPTDGKTGTNKGYGFVAFADPNDYLKAFKEVNGKYIGHHPCTLKKANDLKPGKGKGNGKRR
ncbi:RNA-binding protein 42 [Cyberlindnera fabianii]|uniref:RNA-binding protein 42 n=1 Tax=Cyberlindnera fabianii TaxID=36022 RepID=A0A1V2LC98_CYBFA|nr:RNA-binding protein 42 [Cyberlindnera fabianii]